MAVEAIEQNEQLDVVSILFTLPHVCSFPVNKEMSKSDDCSRFQWRSPRLCDMDGMQNEVEAWRLLLKSIVNDTLVRLLSKGAEARPAMALLSFELTKVLDVWKGSINSASLAHTAHQEAVDIVLFTRMLAEDLPPDHARLQSCMNATQGSKQSLKNAVVGNRHWKDMEAKLRRSAVNMAALNPELQQATQMLADMEGFDTESLSKVCCRVPVWRDALPRGYTPLDLVYCSTPTSCALWFAGEVDRVVNALTKKLEDEVTQLSTSAKTSSGWDAVVEVAQKLSHALSDPSILAKVNKAKTAMMQQTALATFTLTLREASQHDQVEEERVKALREAWSVLQRLEVDLGKSIQDELAVVLPTLFSLVVDTLSEDWADMSTNMLDFTALLLQDILEMAEVVRLLPNLCVLGHQLSVCAKAICPCQSLGASPHNYNKVVANQNFVAPLQHGDFSTFYLQAVSPDKVSLAKLQAEVLHKLALWKRSLSGSFETLTGDMGSLVKVASLEAAASAQLPLDSLPTELCQEFAAWRDGQGVTDSVKLVEKAMESLRKSLVERVENDLQSAVTAGQIVQGGQSRQADGVAGVWHTAVKGTEFSDILYAAGKSLLTAPMYTELRNATGALTKESLTLLVQL
eukprot:6491031-Amphidinium_carterae.2